MVKRAQLTNCCHESFFGGGQMRDFGKNMLIVMAKSNKKSAIRISANSHRFMTAVRVGRI